MTISRQSLVDRAYLRLRAAGREVSAPELDSMVDQALELLGKRLAASDSRAGMTKDFAATPSAGVVDLTALPGILFDINRSGVRAASSSVRLSAVDSIETLERGGLPADQVFYAQDGTDLRFRDTSGSTTSYAAQVEIKSSFVPAMTDITSQYEEALVSTLVELAGSTGAKPEEVAVGRA